MIDYATVPFTNVPTGAGSSDAMPCDGLGDKWVVVRGLSVGTANIQISYDGSNWMTATAAAADAWYEVPQPATHVRINSAGTLTVTAIVMRMIVAS